MRVVRLVLSKGRDGRAKKARDRAAGVDVERIVAQVDHECAAGRACDLDGRIHTGAEYYALHDHRVMEHIPGQFSGRMKPRLEKYHFECLPERADRLRRFFRPPCPVPHCDHDPYVDGQHRHPEGETT